MNNFDKVITITDDKGKLYAIQFHDMTKKSVITYLVTEVGMEESLALLNKIANKIYDMPNKENKEAEIIEENL